MEIDPEKEAFAREQLWEKGVTVTCKCKKCNGTIERPKMKFSGKVKLKMLELIGYICVGLFIPIFLALLFTVISPFISVSQYLTGEEGSDTMSMVTWCLIIGTIVFFVFVFRNIYSADPHSFFKKYSFFEKNQGIIKTVTDILVCVGALYICYESTITVYHWVNQILAHNGYKFDLYDVGISKKIFVIFFIVVLIFTGFLGYLDEKIKKNPRNWNPIKCLSCGFDNYVPK